MANTIKLKRSNVQGKIPTLAQLTAGELAMNTYDEKVFFSSGSSIFELAKTTEYVAKAGDSMTGSLSLPKTSGDGILLDGNYAWVDIIGDVVPKHSGTGAAVFENFIGNIPAWAHTSTSYGKLEYHIPHNYAVGTDIYLHFHWGHNGTSISGDFVIDLDITYAKRTYPASSFVTPVTSQISLTSLNMTNSPQYCHRVDEIKISIPGGSASMLNTNNIEVDGLIMVGYSTSTIPSITGSSSVNLPFVLQADLHMQSTGVGTFNKDPGYYA